ncbi:MAG: diphthine--ammonia ligase [Dehalococcoidia bacterium]|nr:diphthine--ammonia ligase [Dehalococcoidia bacterium]
MTEYAASWSGGKDSCFACWKAISQGLKVSHLLNFINTDSTRAMSHGLDRKLIALQAQAMALPILQQKVTWETYEAGFKEALAKLKLKGITGLITGDIYLQEHKDWIDRVCGESGVKAILPLWKIDTARLLTDFIDAGFKAIVVSVKAKFLGKEWLGRQVDSKLASEFTQMNIDVCGEAGEFHTFVYDGPLFKKPIKIGKSVPISRDSHWTLDIQEYSLGNPSCHSEGAKRPKNPNLHHSELFPSCHSERSEESQPQ